MSDVIHVEEPTHNQEDLLFNVNDADDMHGDMLNEIYEQTVGVSSMFLLVSPFCFFCL